MWKVVVVAYAFEGCLGCGVGLLADGRGLVGCEEEGVLADYSLFADLSD